MEGGEIDLFGAGQADIKHIHTGVLQPLCQRQFQRFAGETHIAAEHNGFRFQVFAVRAANAPRDIFIQLFTQFAANIVGFETG
ncbi:hypothetical protein D3C72_1664840 [compost metagenome]